MPSTPNNHEAHDYAERIRARLPRRLQELRETAGLSMYALWLKCGVSRDMISRVEGGESRDLVKDEPELVKALSEKFSLWHEPVKTIRPSESARGWR